jgi:peptide/nickel transport system permease protein
MTSFILRRLLNGFFVLLGVIVIVFLLFIGLGNPAQLTMGQRSDVSTLASINKEFELDKSKPEQLLYYFKDLSPIATYPDTKENQDKYNYLKLLHYKSPSGDLGVLVVKFPYLRRSYTSQKKVSEILLGALPNTIILALTAFIILSGLFLASPFLRFLRPSLLRGYSVLCSANTPAWICGVRCTVTIHFRGAT